MNCFRFLKSHQRHKMSPIKLTYFNVQGKGETMRLILAAAKVGTGREGGYIRLFITLILKVL